MDMEKVVNHLAQKIASLEKENAVLRVALHEEKEKNKEPE